MAKSFSRHLLICFIWILGCCSTLGWVFLPCPAVAQSPPGPETFPETVPLAQSQALPEAEEASPHEVPVVPELQTDEESPLPAAEGTLVPVFPAEESPLPVAEGTLSPSELKPVPTSYGSFGERLRLTVGRLKPTLPPGLELSGYIKNETAYRYLSPVAFSKILNIFQLEAAYSFSPSIRLYARTWSFYDLAYDFQDMGTIAPMKPLEFIQPPDPGEPEPDIKNIREIDIDRSGILLKEFYLDIFMPKADLRIGKQIVRWGIVEGWRILDEVNPLDFTEHILRDVTDRYIPLWMVKADFYIGPITAEGLWIPDVKGHKPAPLRSEWSQFQVLPNFKAVPRTFGNSEWGGRFSGTLMGVELVLTSLYHWDDFPTAFRSVSGLGLGSLGIAPEVDFTPVQRRLQTVGMGASKSFGKIVLEGEVAYTKGKYWGTSSDQKFGEERKDYIKHVLGFKTVFFGADLSLNFSQDIILDHIPEIQQDRIENTASLFARREMRYGSLIPQILVISLLNRDEWLFRPKLEHKYSDKVSFLYGVDIFSGAAAERDPATGQLDPGRLNFFGYFDKDDRAYVEIKYSF